MFFLRARETIETCTGDKNPEYSRIWHSKPDYCVFFQETSRREQCFGLIRPVSHPQSHLQIYTLTVQILVLNLVELFKITQKGIIHQGQNICCLLLSVGFVRVGFNFFSDVFIYFLQNHIMHSFHLLVKNEKVLFCKCKI